MSRKQSVFDINDVKFKILYEKNQIQIFKNDGMNEYIQIPNELIEMIYEDIQSKPYINPVMYLNEDK